ncbi:MAG: FxsA family protein [Hyphomicrobiaceae bacterium]|nr:FxsA family protein [Hyphomicrobiaceae bacterium]
MPLLILLLFIGLPIAEIAVLIKVADVIELGPTIGLIILTAVIGVYLLRRQGLSSMMRAQNSLEEGRLPVDSISDAVGLLLAGAFLLTPGLITDSLGFALLIPAVRHGIASHLFKKAANARNIHVDMFGSSTQTGPERNPFDDFPPRQNPPRPHSGPVIEGEIIEPKSSSKADEKPKNDKSPWKPS